MHLREDRRHIQDRDVRVLRETIKTKMNLEMANSPEILEIALATGPEDVCLVPEKREEVTTEGGLDVVGQAEALAPTLARLAEAGIRVSLFIDPDARQVEAAARTGAEMIELHTGAFANAEVAGGLAELAALKESATRAHGTGLQVNAGHGINVMNLVRLMEVPHLAELNIGHHLVSRAIFGGLGHAVREMLGMMACYERWNAATEADS